MYQNPEKFYTYGFTRFRTLRQAEPNRAHQALFQLEEQGLLRGVITQNIDGLHQKAGNRNIWEVHGHLRSGYCTSCQKEVSFEHILSQLDKEIIPPRCECNGMLRPSVVLFGDTLGEAFSQAVEHLRQGCDLMIVAGSSLMVQPVATLPQLASRLIIINLQPTPFDGVADLVFRQECGEVLEDLTNQIGSL